MNEQIGLAIRVTAIGISATLLMDLWNLFLKQFGIKSLNYAFLGRWIGHLTKGKWLHDNIANAAPVRGESLIGWCAHYSIGVTFAAILVAAYGAQWVRSPSLPPALLVGIATVAAPFLVLQPAIGAGIASSKTPTPTFSRIKSLGTHTVYGIGLYLSAVVTSSFIPW